MTTATIRDAYQHLEELEPGTRWTMEELRDYIQEKGLRYDELDQAFWDGLLDSSDPGIETEWTQEDAGTDRERWTLTLASGNRLEVYWDDSDPASIGWAYRLIGNNPDEGDEVLDSGGLDGEADSPPFYEALASGATW